MSKPKAAIKWQCEPPDRPGMWLVRMVPKPGETVSSVCVKLEASPHGLGFLKGYDFYVASGLSGVEWAPFEEFQRQVQDQLTAASVGFFPCPVKARPDEVQLLGGPWDGSVVRYNELHCRRGDGWPPSIRIPRSTSLMDHCGHVLPASGAQRVDEYVRCSETRYRFARTIK